jgi:hypothetical protein
MRSSRFLFTGENYGGGGFVAGLLYLLCFEHVDNIGANSIPSETGLLIPFISDS